MAQADNLVAFTDVSMERLLTAVFMAISVAVAITDDELRFITANVRFLKAFGVASKEIAGRRLTDFLTVSDLEALTKARAEQSADGRPFETVGRATGASGTIGELTARVETVTQPGFKRIRVVTLLDPEQGRSAMPEIADERFRALVQTTPAGQVIIAGTLKLIGLDEVRTALGDRWQSHAERVMTIAERVIRRRMMPQDIVSRTDDQGFVVCFAGVSEEEAAFRAAGIAREIREFLIGESDDPDAAAVSVMTRALLIEHGELTEPTSLLRSLEDRLAAAREQAIRLAEEDLRRLLHEVRLEPQRLYDRNGNPTPIAYATLPAAHQGRLDVAAGTLPPDHFASLDTELLLLTLAGEWGIAKVAATGKPTPAEPDVRVDVYVVPIDFSIFATHRKLDALNRICSNLPTAVRQRLILSVRNLPRTITQSRLQEIIGQLKPFARGLGLELRQASDAPLDLMQYRFALVGISAERLLDPEKSQSVKKLIARTHAANLRLVAIGATTGQVRALTAHGVDYHVLDGHVLDPPANTRPGQPGDVEDGAIATVARAALDAVTSGFVVTDPTLPDNPIVLANPAFHRMTGYGAEEILGRNARLLQGPATDRAIVGEISLAIEKREAITRRLLNYRKDGTAFWAEMTIAPVFAKDGRLVNFIGSQRDVSEEQRAKSAHRRISSLFDRVTATMPGYIFQRTVLSDGRIEFPYLSRSFRRLLGLPADTPLTGDTFLSRVHPDDVALLRRVGRDTIRNPFSIEYRLVHWDGELRWIKSNSTPVVQSNGVTVLNGVAVDITDQKTAEERLSYLGEYDALTGLYNRSKYHAALTELAGATAIDCRSLFLFAIDVIGFHEINETFGWTVGDQIIIQIAERLKLLSPPSAKLFHLSAGDFAIVSCSNAALEEAEQLAQAICVALARPFDIDDTMVRLQVNVGVSVNDGIGFGADGSPDSIARELERRTELALYEARNMGPGLHCLYRPEIDDRLRNKVLLQQSLHGAIEQHQFQLHYQPLVDLASGRIVGAEALIRWHHPTLGLQRPDLFIPLAEESGLIVPLGDWVLRTGIRSLREWPKFGAARTKLAINVSGVQLERGDLLAVLNEALADGHIDPTQIELELTESSLVHSSDRAVDILRAIRGRGIGIAIDDFGTGYSSFQYVRELPITKLKIDQSFVRHLSPASSDASIVRAIIGLGKSMALDVVAEGVETALQRQFLVGEGCRVGQGYYFSPPLAEEDLLRKLRQNSILPTS
jgi:PAS domain S-box-containing protein/diguanylate cyclase (GGDEF)-like protein